MIGDSIKADLATGEQLLWEGRPKQGLIFRSGDIFFIPFSILWASFAFYGEYSVLSANLIIPAALGLIFVAAGMHLLIGRFFEDSYLRSRTTYAITDRRVMVLQSGRFGKTTTIELANLPPLMVDKLPDGSGTITFGDIPPMPFLRTLPPSIRYYQSWETGKNVKFSPAFELIPEVSNVREILRKAQEAVKI